MTRRAIAPPATLAMALAALTLASCAHKRPPPPPPPPIHYVLEPAWQGDGLWFYPHERFAFDATGLAAIIPPGHPPLTTDNELYDPRAMAASMQAVQLPAIATVTNLENGRQVDVRVNDRGPANPGRLIGLTPGVAALLGIDAGAARVRVTFDQPRTMALSRQVQGAAGDLPIQAAPRGDVQQTTLAPLAGTSAGPSQANALTPTLAAEPDAPTLSIPLHLPATVRQTEPDPGTLMIDASSFGHENAARLLLQTMPDVGARLIRTRSGGQTVIALRVGPLDSIAQADATLARMIADGITEARITIDPAR